MRYLVAYDVADDKRRAKVVKQLLNFGRRIQFSVFECDLEAVDYLRMCRKVEAALDFKQDRLHIIPLCTSCVGRTVAQGPAVIPADSLAAWLI
jgi:CRISPR-associated protein Cas2